MWKKAAVTILWCFLQLKVGRTTKNNENKTTVTHLEPLFLQISFSDSSKSLTLYLVYMSKLIDMVWQSLKMYTRYSKLPCTVTRHNLLTSSVYIPYTLAFYSTHTLFTIEIVIKRTSLIKKQIKLIYVFLHQTKYNTLLGSAHMMWPQ